MGKYVYISYIMWKEGANVEFYNKEIKPKLKNEKVELLHDGVAYGVLEDSVMIHRTDLDIEAFRKFRVQACTVNGKSWIERARTIISTPF